MDKFQLLASLGIAVVTAWFTVKLALQRFQSEKWFERKLDAYTRVIDALHHMKTTTDRERRSEERGHDLPDAIRKELQNAYHSNFAEVRRLSDMGSLLFSSDAIGALDSLLRELAAATPEEGWYLYYVAQSEAIDKCLVNIRDIAKRDLGA